MVAFHGASSTVVGVDKKWSFTRCCSSRVNGNIELSSEIIQNVGL